MRTSSDVIVIGGGITGVATAYELARRGVHVTVVERADLHAMGSGWSLAGVRQSGRHPAELPVAVRAIERWQTLGEELGADVEYRREGNLRLALTDEDVPNIQQVVTDGMAAGIPIRYLESIEDIHQIAPLLTDGIAGASFCESDGHANNHRTVQAYAAAARRYGAELRTNAHVSGIAVKDDHVAGVLVDNELMPSETVVVAAGIYSPRLLADLDLSYPIEVTVCPVIQTVPSEHRLAPVLGVAGGYFAGRQEADGRFRLIGTSIPWTEIEHSEYNTGPSLKQIEDTISMSLHILPGLEDVRIAKTWGGLIDMTPDALPVLDASTPVAGLVIGSGFSGHGFGIGPASGEILADLATGTTPAFDLAPFRLDRFQSGEYSAEKALLHG